MESQRCLLAFFWTCLLLKSMRLFLLAISKLPLQFCLNNVLDKFDRDIVAKQSSTSFQHRIFCFYDHSRSMAPVSRPPMGDQEKRNDDQGDASPPVPFNEFGQEDDNGDRTTNPLQVYHAFFAEYSITAEL